MISFPCRRSDGSSLLFRILSISPKHSSCRFTSPASNLVRSEWLEVVVWASSFLIVGIEVAGLLDEFSEDIWSLFASTEVVVVIVDDDDGELLLLDLDLKAVLPLLPFNARFW